MTLDNGTHRGGTRIAHSRLARRISAEAAAALVHSGDWLDYGAVLAQPDAFDKALAQRIGGLHNVNVRGGVRNLGVHTEMLTDGIIELYRAGVVTGSTKTVHPGKIVCSFGLGSKATYDAIHDNPDISCQPVDMTNLPHLIIQNDRLTAINNTTQMDLQGQAASESDGHRHISGTGGQLQFIRGAYASSGASRSCACRRPTNATAIAAVVWS